MAVRMKMKGKPVRGAFARRARDWWRANVAVLALALRFLRGGWFVHLG